MEFPFGKIEGNKLIMRFSSADYTVATVIAGIREHLDVIEAMGVEFLGVETEVVAGPSVTFSPVPVVAYFAYDSKEKKAVLKEVYQLVWKGIVNNFPSELEWAQARSSFADFISSQADLLLARKEVSQD